jgi:hypothetical protein
MINSVNYANGNSYKVYTTHIALKTHFTNEKYDYHKYSKKLTVSFDKFQTKPDLIHFNKLYKMNDWENIILANVLDDPNKWIGEIADKEGKEVYLKWKSKIDSITYTVQKDLSKLKDDFQENFTVKNGGYPYLLDLYLQYDIDFETFTILSHVTNVLPYWEEKVLDKIVAYDILVKSKKYYPFLEIDVKKINKIIKDRFY